MRACGTGTPIEPRRRQPADAAADHDEVVAFLDRHGVDGEGRAIAHVMSDLERAGMLPAQAGQRRRIAQRLRRDLRRRRQAGRDRQRRAVEKIATGNVAHVAPRSPVARQTKPRLIHIDLPLARAAGLPSVRGNFLSQEAGSIASICAENETDVG